MPSNKQRRESTRRQLELQLKERQAREARRRRATLIASIAGTLAVIVVIVVVIVVVSSSGDDTSTKTASKPSTTPTSAVSTPKAAAPQAGTPAACTAPTKAATASFKGVTVGAATDLKHEPKVTSKGAADPTALECADLLVGTGKAATPTSTVSVQYTGVLYRKGTQFDSSWARGAKPVSFPLTGVVPGFTQGIGGTGKVAPMRVGGRRIMVLPSSLGYGAQASGAIPANSSLVFVVDLVSVK